MLGFELWNRYRMVSLAAPVTAASPTVKFFFSLLGALAISTGLLNSSAHLSVLDHASTHTSQLIFSQCFPFDPSPERHLAQSLDCLLHLSEEPQLAPSPYYNRHGDLREHNMLQPSRHQQFGRQKLARAMMNWLRSSSLRSKWRLRWRMKARIQRA